MLKQKFNTFFRPNVSFLSYSSSDTKLMWNKYPIVWYISDRSEFATFHSKNMIFGKKNNLKLILSHNRFKHVIACVM